MPNRLHAGERYVQEQMHTPRELADQIPGYIQANMPLSYADFFAGLPYIALASLDDRGRPWVSLLVTQSSVDPAVGIRVQPQNQTQIEAEVNPHDPFARAVQQSAANANRANALFAGVGVDFSNRARIKIAGSVESAASSGANRLSLRLDSDQHLGNCPKYITVRELRHRPREAELDLDRFESFAGPLPEACRAHINRASTVFLATKHTDETKQTPGYMGLNHRGGAPGFVSVYEEARTNPGGTSTYLVLPDYSGNRFYQSLGNIQGDALVGLAIPDFTTGDMLYVTGSAENLYDREAQRLMARTRLVTRIELTGAVFVRAGLNLELASAEQFSPYNPPLRYLNRELEQLGYPVESGASPGGEIAAKLTASEQLSASISTFTFQLSEPVAAPLPGGFGVFDFSDLFRIDYAHMNDRNPQSLNEDCIRTWTVSSAPDYDAERERFAPVDQLQVTVKRKAGGLISSFLHEYGPAPAGKMKLKFRGTGGRFSCFSHARGDGDLPATDIALLFAGRDDDVALVRRFFDSNGTGAPGSLRAAVFQTVSDPNAGADLARQLLSRDFAHAPLTVEQRRIEYADFADVESLGEREAYLCGPEAFMQGAVESLLSLGVAERRIHRESFYF